MKSNKDIPEILALIEDKNHLNLHISPIKMFSPCQIDNNFGNTRKFDFNQDDEDSIMDENSSHLMTDLDTFRSKEVDQALEKAQLLMKFKHDKEFINKVLDA